MSTLTQAQQLSSWVRRKGGAMRVLAITSGKQGVGKTLLAVRLAEQLSRKGQRVLILDSDPGHGNVELMMGVHPAHTLADVLTGRCSLQEAIAFGPHKIGVIAAGVGLSDLTRRGEAGQLTLLAQIAALPTPPDYLILDAGEGVGDNARFLTACAQDILVVTTRDADAITDAYALMKVMGSLHGERRFRLVVNRVEDQAEALSVYRRLSSAADQFLGVSIDFAGFLPMDPAVSDAARGQRIGRWHYAAPSPAQVALTELAETILTWQRALVPNDSVQFYWDRISGMPSPMTAGG